MVLYSAVSSPLDRSKRFTLYDADPFSEDTIEAGTNLDDHIKETRKLKWEETITGIAQQQ